MAPMDIFTHITKIIFYAKQSFEELTPERLDETYRWANYNLVQWPKMKALIHKELQGFLCVVCKRKTNFSQLILYEKIPDLVWFHYSCNLLFI